MAAVCCNWTPESRYIIQVVSITLKKKIVQVYAPTTSYSEDGINSFYNDVDEILRKPNHYTIGMGNFNAQIGKRKQTYGNGNGQMWARIEKRKRRHLGRMGNIKKLHNHEYHVPEESREEM